MRLEPISYNGFWHLVGSDQKVSGILEYHPDHGIVLKVNGTLESKTFRAFGGAETKHDIVLGTTSLGQHVTLVDCSENDYTSCIGGDGYPESQYGAQLAFIGEHFQKRQDILFSRMLMGATNLSIFVGTTGIGPGPQSADRNVRVTVAIKPAEEFSFHVDGWSVETVHLGNCLRGANQLSVSEEAFYAISPR